MNLVSYNDKHNEANGEENRDGHSNNHSWNHGVEGPTDDPVDQGIARAPAAQSPGDTASLQGHADESWPATSSAIPQNGNNNAYAQDNPMTWLDWERITPEGPQSPGVHAQADCGSKGVPVFCIAAAFAVGQYNEELDVKRRDLALAHGARNGPGAVGR